LPFRLDTLRKDVLFSELTQGGVAARTMGDFLKSFGNRHLEIFQELIVEISFELRLKFFPENKKFILAMDSTPHEHYAKNGRYGLEL